MIVLANGGEVLQFAGNAESCVVLAHWGREYVTWKCYYDPVKKNWYAEHGTYHSYVVSENPDLALQEARKRFHERVKEFFGIERIKEVFNIDRQSH